jgi:hypothetical protein
MNEITKPLTKTEKSDLEKYKVAITKLAHSYMECYPMLLDLRDRRLYREECSTFEEFCQNHWGFTRRWVDEVISSGVAVQGLPKDLRTKVLNLGAARALKKIKPEKRADAVKKAAKNGDSVAQALEDIRKQQEEEAGIVTHESTDSEGYPIPAGLEEFYERRSETDAALKQLTQVRVWFKKLWNANDPLVRYVPQHVRQHLDDAWTCIKESRPDVVCLHCDGNHSYQCGACKGTGFISRWRADNDQTGKRAARNKKLKK